MNKQKLKKCRICKTEYSPSLPLQFVCSPKCALEWKRRQDAKKQAKKDRQARLDKRELKAKDLAWQKEVTQKAFNEMRRLEEFKWFKDRGMEPTCISCGEPLGNDQWACGHFKTVGAQSVLRFDRKNAYLQHNIRCNRHLSGDIYGTKTTRGYIQGLKDRFGYRKAKEIIDYCESHAEPRKWTCEELEVMRKEFNAEIRKLKKELDIE